MPASDGRSYSPPAKVGLVQAPGGGVVGAVTIWALVTDCLHRQGRLGW